MAVEVGAAYVSIVPSARDFGRKLQSDINPGLDSAGRDGGKRFGGGFLAAARSAIGPLAAIFAAGAITDFIGDAFNEARESQKVGALTANVIKTTGGAAKVTADQVNDLSTAISNKTGIDDEAIQSAANLLLTFTNVKNEVGEGNDVFNLATQAATDMATALGKDPKDSAIQLGKALNDPVKGITALSKAGVSFTDDQKEQIKTLVKGGDVVGAQKIILGELSKEFGGAAEASATAGDKFATTFANFKEDIGTALLPLLDTILGKASEFFTFLQKKVFPAVGGIFDFITKGDITGSLLDAFGLEEDDPIVATFVNIRDGIIGAFDRARDVVSGFFNFLTTGAVVEGGLADALGLAEDNPIVVGFDNMRDKVIEILGRVRDAIGGLFTFITTGDITGGLLNALGLTEDDPIIAAIVKIRDSVITNLGTARDAIGGFFSALSGEGVTSDGAVGIAERLGVFLRDELPPAVATARAIFGAIVEYIVTQVVPRIEAIVGAIQNFLTVAIPIIQQFVDGMQQRFEPILPKIQAIFGTIGAIISAALELIAAIVDRVTSVITFIWTNWGEGIMNFLAAVWSAVVGIVKPALDIILALVRTFTALFRGDWEGVWTGIQGIVQGVLDLAIGIIRGALGIIKELFSAGLGAVLQIASLLWDQIKQAIIERATGVVDYVKTLPGQMVEGLGNLGGLLVEAGKNLISGFIEGIKSQASGVIDAIRASITDALPDFVKSALGISSPSKVFMELGAFTAQGMALGLQSGGAQVQRAADSLVPSLVPPSFGSLAPLPLPAGGPNAGSGGAQVEQRFYGDIVTKDYSDFVRQQREEARKANLGSRGAVMTR